MSYRRRHTTDNIKKQHTEKDKNSNNEIETRKKNQAEIVVLKNTIEIKKEKSQWRNPNSRLDQSGKRIIEFQDKVRELEEDSDP